MIERLREAWKNAYYRGTTLYVAVMVTLIFGLQLYRFFLAAPSSKIICPPDVSKASLIPLIGVLFDGG